MKSGLETERKYLIENPDIARISSIPGYTVSNIEQIYLTSEKGITERVRRREYKDKIEYTHNTKRRVGAMSAYETEEEIDESEYLALAKRLEEGTAPLYKTRHTFPHGEFTVEIDVYPAFPEFSVMEIELPSEDTQPELPAFIKVIKEVTSDRSYSNHALARRAAK